MPPLASSRLVAPCRSALQSPISIKSTTACSNSGSRQFSTSSSTSISNSTELQQQQQLSQQQHPQAIKKLSTLNLQEPTFKPLGTPQTLLFVQAPPSVPVYFKKNSLLALYFPDSALGSNVNVAGTDSLDNINNSDNSSDTDGTSANANANANGLQNAPSSQLQLAFNEILFSELKYLNLTNSLLSFHWPTAYQKTISTVPFNALLKNDQPTSAFSSSSSDNAFRNFFNNLFGLIFNSSNSTKLKTFHHLQLDGTADWAIFPPRAIHAFSGTNLQIRNKLAPSRVSKHLARQIAGNASGRGANFGGRIAENVERLSPFAPKIKTGLNGAHYSFVTGRGEVAVSGNGETFEVELEVGETMLVNKRNLLGLRINGAEDLLNLVYFQSLISKNATGVLVSEAETETTDVSEASTNGSILVDEPASTKYLRTARVLATKTFYSLQKALAITSRWLFNATSSNNNYITVVGPTKLLLQASANEVKLANLPLGNNASATTIAIANEAASAVGSGATASTNSSLEVKNEDRLSYVTINNGKAVFESTPDFQETVDRIQQRAAKQQ